MKNKKIQLGVEQIRQIKMTEVEKKRIFNNVINTPIKTREAIKSTWVVSMFSFNLKNYPKIAFYILLPMFIIFTSGAMAFASQGSLPSDILYPIKTKVVEPLGGALKFKHEAQASYQSNLASLRLSEAEILARQDKLDKKKEDKLNNLLIEHARSFHKAVDKATKVELSEKVEKIVVNFQNEMNEYANTLDEIAKSKNFEKELILQEEDIDNSEEFETLEEETIETIKNLGTFEEEDNGELETLENNSNNDDEKKENIDNSEKLEISEEDLESFEDLGMFEEKDINNSKKLETLKEEDYDELETLENNNNNNNDEKVVFKISETARLNADKAKEKIVKEEKKEDTNKEEDTKEFRYKDKKESIDMLIDKINQHVDSDFFIQSEIEIIGNIFENLNKAKFYLKEAEQKVNVSHLEEAYIALLRAEEFILEVVDVVTETKFGNEINLN